MRRGQQALEFMAVFSVAIALFVIFYIIFAQQYSENVRKMAQQRGIMIADQFATEIDIAARAGDGYERKVSFPLRIPGAISYSLKVNNRSGSVDINLILDNFESFYYSSPTLTRNITGEPSYAVGDGYMINITQELYIDNERGMIVLNHTKAG